MSEPSAFGFGQFVPGFDFLQNLSKTSTQAQPAAAAGMPGMASWVAPTLSVEEIDKRIQELKSVLFWLEQNTTALKATIQAMEVQKMTLSTLQSMNVSMADLAKAFTAKPPATASATTAPQAAPEPEAAGAPEENTDADKASAKPAVDPMQWWGALTQQFQDIAAAAVKDVAAEAMKAGMTAKAATKSAAPKKSPAAKKASSKTPASAPSAPRKTATKRKTA
jgi:hypothetical protein